MILSNRNSTGEFSVSENLQRHEAKIVLEKRAFKTGSIEEFAVTGSIFLRGKSMSEDGIDTMGMGI